MSVRGYIEIEWRIPWPAEWDNVKKRRAADRLAGYMRDGTFVDLEKRRLPLLSVDVQPKFVTNTSPYLVFRLEI